MSIGSRKNGITEIVFLGTGDSMGVPRVYCDCEVCGEARFGGINRRLRSSILVRDGSGELLVDCGPDWKTQMESLGIRLVRDLLITHAHFDHIGGLPELADMCRWTGVKANVYAPGEVLETVRRQFPWVGNHLAMHAIDEGARLNGWRINPFKVFHGKNGFSFAYRFERGDTAWVYCPDSINLQEEAKARMRNLRLLILGTSFFKEEAPFHTRSIYDMAEALVLLNELKPGEALFTHMSHGVDLRAGYRLPPRVRLAIEGDTIILST